MHMNRIGQILVILGGCLLTAAPAARADDPSTPTRTVDVMNRLWGRHPGIRANHAKGVVVDGSFTPTPAAAALSRTSLFQGAAVPLILRFSDATGIPTLPDGAPNANPHGMSVKFHLPDGHDMDVVTNSLKFFPVPTGDAFLEMLTAVAASGPGTPRPTPAEQFMARHPAAPAALATVATPTSFARETYFGIDAFVFVDKAGHRQPFRLQFVPAAGTEHLSAAEAARQPPDFLVDELPARLARGPVTFHMVAQLANPGDQTKDPTQPWPDDRKTVDLGTLTLTGVTPNAAAVQKTLLMLPDNIPDGIEVSDDPLIAARSNTYPISFGRRVQ